MGGRAFPGLTRRYEADEYHALVPEVLEIVSAFSSKCVAIPAYQTKPSFGDMDVLFTQKMPVNIDLLDAVFNCGENVIHNGGVWSLMYKDFQIDLINTPTDEFDVALNYFQFNDWGNLRGRIHHKLGLKFGHDGLWFPVRSADHTLGEILLSRDPVKINEFGNFSAVDNFEYLEEIFAHVAASKYFNPDIFLLENRNHTARVRDRKRATYTAFLEWCKTLPPREYYQFDRDKSVYHKKIFKAFPHAVKEFDALWARKLLVEQAAALFNGDLVKALTGRENAALGELMKVLKLQLTPDVVVSMMDTEIHKVIMHEHQLLSHTKDCK